MMLVMADKKTKGKRVRASDDTPSQRISTEAIRGVSAIFLIALAGFLVLAMLGGGGAIGSFLYQWLAWLFGIGYFLLPLSFIMLAVAIMRSFEKQVGVIQFASMAVFLLASLGLVNIAFDKGGVLGALISKPIVAGVDVTATVFFLFSFIIASLVVAFDVHLGALFASVRDWVRDRSSLDSIPTDDTNAPVTGLVVEPDAQAEQNAPEYPKENAESEPIPKTARVVPLAESSDGFPIIATTGDAYEPPPVSILAKNKGKPEVGDVKANMNIIKRTFLNFGIQVEMDEASIGPTVTRYSMKPAEGVRLSKIVALQSNLELSV